MTITAKQCGQINIRVLIIDDDPDYVFIVKDMLSHEGKTAYTLTSASSLSDGLAHLAREATDVILLDLSLSDSRGLSTFQSIHEHWPGIPVVVLTGWSDESVGVEAIHQGAQDYLLKFHANAQNLPRVIRYAIERKTADRAVETLKRQYEMILQSAGDGIIGLDAKGYVTFANEASARMLGYSVQELIGQQHHGLFHDQKKTGEPCPLEECLLLNLFRDKLYHHLEKEVFVKKNKEPFPVELTCTPILRDQNQVQGGVVIFKDIRERLLAEEKSREALMMKSHFITKVSHELRTPLAAIMQNLDLVYTKTAGEINPDQSEFLGAAKRNVDRLGRLINEILDLQKWESGKNRLTLSSVDLNELIRSVIKTEQPRIEKKKLKLIVQLDEKLPRIKIDHDKITQVLSNILDNAVKYTDQGHIQIETKVKGPNNLVTVKVSDTGIGIKGKDLPKLFQCFSRMDESHNRGSGSGGLGLAISKEIIEEHGGKIWAESEYGRGTSFTFMVPIQERRAS